MDPSQFSGADAMFGTSSAQEVQDLNKALMAGDQTGAALYGSTTSSGAPLKVESLENSLKILTFKESDITFWKMINKAPAYNTVEEFNQLLDYGADNGGFTNEGELPEEADSTYRRMAEHVKFLGVTRGVSHPMQLVKTQPGIGSAIQRELQNGMMWILRKANRSLAFGDSALIDQEWNGLYAQHRNAFSSINAYHSSESVIDLRGQPLTDDILEDSANAVIENHGYADTLMAPPVVLTDYVKQFLTMKLIQPNSPQVTAGVMGQRVTSVATQFGDVKLGYDKFLKTSPPKSTNSGAESAKAPNSPTAGSTPLALTASLDPFSKFITTDDGDYKYAVTAFNRFGQSALVALNSAAFAVTAGKSVDISFVDGGGAYAATGYTIYRTKKDDTATGADLKYYPLFSVNTSQKGAGYDNANAGLVRDRNRWLADTQQAILFENSTDVYEFKQLAPMMKMDLAITGPMTRFMVLLYGTPQLYSPKKLVRYINIGKAI